MKKKKLRVAPFLCLLATLPVLPSQILYADDVYPFLVSFEDVPGTESLLTGDIRRGIRELENALHSGAESHEYIQATLCGAYVLAREFDLAKSTCEQAVNHHPGETAFNNRGVFRAFTGDYEGARKDFERARPADMDKYLDALREKDVGLIANDNFELLAQLEASLDMRDNEPAYARLEGATLEAIDD